MTCGMSIAVEFPSLTLYPSTGGGYRVRGGNCAGIRVGERSPLGFALDPVGKCREILDRSAWILETTDSERSVGSEPILEILRANSDGVRFRRPECQRLNKDSGSRLPGECCPRLTVCWGDTLCCVESEFAVSACRAWISTFSRRHRPQCDAPPTTNGSRPPCRPALRPRSLESADR